MLVRRLCYRRERGFIQCVGDEYKSYSDLLLMDVVRGRCRNGWLKKASKGMRSRGLRRSRPMSRLHSSGLVPAGIL